MVKLEELKSKLKEYQEQHRKLLQTDRAASARYGDEFRDTRLRVLESLIRDIKAEIAGLKTKKRIGLDKFSSLL
jgi:hypothetical protein